MTSDSGRRTPDLLGDLNLGAFLLMVDDVRKGMRFSFRARLKRIRFPGKPLSEEEVRICCDVLESSGRMILEHLTREPGARRLIRDAMGNIAEEALIVAQRSGAYTTCDELVERALEFVAFLIDVEWNLARIGTGNALLRRLKDDERRLLRVMACLSRKRRSEAGDLLKWNRPRAARVEARLRAKFPEDLTDYLDELEI